MLDLLGTLTTGRIGKFRVHRQLAVTDRVIKKWAKYVEFAATGVCPKFWEDWGACPAELDALRGDNSPPNSLPQVAEFLKFWTHPRYCKGLTFYGVYVI